MGILSKIFGRKSADSQTVKIGGMEDFMMLIRVYFQAVMASELHITNLAALPDLRMFKATLKVPTQAGRLGVGEKSKCKKMVKEMYQMDDQFFKEIDQSVARRCKKVQDAQPYLLQFQAYVQDMMMLTTNLMKFKLRMPSFFKKAIYTMTEKTVHDIYTKNDYKDAGVIKTVLAVREYNKRLNFSEKWATDFVYRVVMLAKKEKQPKGSEKGRK
ncbi:MAG: hypothetical protein IJ546_04100 [Prevotella sp.]|nr:hypothetical protein [Prevotella sp.]